ncbi:hypothetical protein BCR44DRAFT_50811 [Catenaria anguillulae PL171]|uniref:Reelin domain-containing protein n=1 Tax=Catenaria anguillulae PL171 TaxID=765915 RepID=A0A1Y2HNV2_9FUNG|nr:hypothetical protein BCR44DRAFT_50811 [Catenaria anguillulae PL171]
MLSIVATSALALLMVFFSVHPAAAYSAGLTICDITETRMLAGMGGANSPFLSMDLNVTRIDASTATVSVFSTNATVTSTGIRGLLLWATDATGARVGTWTVRQGQQLFAPVNLCNGGAVSHSGAGVKSFDASSATAPQGFTVTIGQSNVPGPISIRAMVVFTRRVWMLVGAKEVQGLTGPVSSGNGTNTTSTNTTNSATSLRGPGAGGALAGNGHATMMAIVAALVSLFLAL